VSQYVKREPYPFSIKVGGVGLLLGSPGPNQPALISTKSQDLSQVQPPDYSYGGTSPLSDRQEPFESLALGMGLRLQEKWQDFRYAQAMGVDLSVWPWCKGPYITDLAPATRDTVNGIRCFFELAGNLFAANGHYILKQTAPNVWTVAADFGASLIRNVEVFTSNFDGVQRAFVALHDAPARFSADGTTWTPMATFHASSFLALGREFWWGDDINRLRKCDVNADPTNEANYTGLIFRAGDKAAPISDLVATAAGQMLILKTDGIYTLDITGTDQQLYPFLKFALRADNGRVTGQFENDLYVGYGQSFFRLSADLTLEDIGPDRLISNDGPVAGQITAFAGLGTMFAYALLHNPDTGNSYLMKFGGFVTSGMTGQGNEPAATRVDAWHGSLSHAFMGKVGTALFVSAHGTSAAGHTRTYIGFSDGTISVLQNPCTPNPASCDLYAFSTADDWVDLPLWHGGYHASQKTLRHIAVTGPVLNVTNYVTVEYRTDPVGAWVDLGNNFDQVVIEEFPFPNGTTTTLGSFRIHLHNAAPATSPLVSSVAIGHALRPQRIMTFEADLLCADGLVRRDGVPMRIGRKEIQRIVEAAVDNKGTIRCVLPDETVQDLSFTDYQVRQAFDEVGRQWRGSLRVKGVQWTTEVA
jgi:hypothetical protein